MATLVWKEGPSSASTCQGRATRLPADVVKGRTRRSATAPMRRFEGLLRTAAGRHGLLGPAQPRSISGGSSALCGAGRVRSTSQDQRLDPPWNRRSSGSSCQAGYRASSWVWSRAPVRRDESTTRQLPFIELVSRCRLNSLEFFTFNHDSSPLPCIWATTKNGSREM